MKSRQYPAVVFVFLALAACDPGKAGEDAGDGGDVREESDGVEAPVSPSDNPDDWPVDTSVEYDLQVSAPQWIIPASNLPPQAVVLTGNNNIAIALFEGRLFAAWRSAPAHFASSETVLNVISSTDNGRHWDFERLVQMGTDVREPFLLEAGGRLCLTWFEAGTNPVAFEPKHIWRSWRRGRGDWSEPEIWGEPGEVPWEAKARRGRVWFTRYLGNHYSSGEVSIDVRFFVSNDGVEWSAVGGASPAVYSGGCSEAGFEFDADGSLWAVLRNEDGDATGFGSQLCHAPADNLGTWSCLPHSDPERYDSPRMLRHGDDIYLVARRDVGGPYDQGRSDLLFEQRRNLYLREYSLRPKRAAVYAIDKTTPAIVHLADLPSAGDTAFPSIRRTGSHTFLVANYTSPIDDPDISWLDGQASSEGTAIYLVTLTFVPRPSPRRGGKKALLGLISVWRRGNLSLAT